jgi:hypothetical protein
VKVNSILDIFGALILLSAIALVVRNPQIVSTTWTGFNNSLRIAKS